LETVISKKLKANTRISVGEIAHLHFETSADEARGVIQKILELKTEDRSWNDFAILVRANDHADPFLQALERAEIPYEFLASRGLFSKPIILDVLAFLRLLDNYHESRALFRVLGLPMWNISPLDIHSIIAAANRKAVSVYEALLAHRAITNVAEKTHRHIETLLALVDRFLARTRDARPSALILQFLQESGYLEYLNEFSREHEQDAREQISHLEQFMRVVTNYERSSDQPNVKGLVEEVNLAQESGDTGSTVPLDHGPESVKVLTIHGAKGLEFPFVFLVNCVDKRFPSIERKDPIDIPEGLVREIVPEGDVHLQEERRLFYVAVTRAKCGVFFTSAEDYGGARKKKLSRFLMEAGLAKDVRANPRPHGNVFFEAEAAPSPPAKKTQPLPMPKTFSYSQISSFRTCPYQYRFAHILHIPVPGKASFSFGNTIHKTLYEFLRRIRERSVSPQQALFAANAKAANTIQPSSLDELLAIYTEKWIDDWYRSKKEKEEHKKKGAEYLKAWYESHNGEFPLPKYLEKGFHLRVGEYTVKGFIDRIDPCDGGVEIMDYKTGRAKTERTADFEQLFIYALAARETLGEDVRRLSYLYLEGNTAVSVEPDEKRLAKVKDQLLETIQRIQSSDFQATPSPQVCARCDYNTICEFSKARRM
ncbi:MAG: ATP-dependent helicase, partial [Candidatus Kerfeldbacteria bacterium]|nr:ATP-dependent helicase [Candidatus Kerfeldbacteria bacterium]